MKYNSLEEFLPAWVEALRSGKYKQGSDSLRYAQNNFCCLGVAYDLLVEDGQCSWTQPSRNVELWCTGDGSTYSLLSSEAPSWFKDWLSKPFLGDSVFFYKQDKLIDMNDRERSSFAKIADFIEKEARNG